MNRINKKAQQYSWIFSLIIGAIIIFLALFSAGKYTETSGLKEQAELVREFDILLNPFASIGSIATMTLSKSIKMPDDVQMRFTCNANFNYDEINLRTKRRGDWDDWLENGFKVRDKYIFSEDLEGREFWLFAKPFEMPWRVDDLIYITDNSYCFEDAPENIKREIQALKADVISLKEDGCIPGSIEVCFGIRSCEINVNYQLETVKKDGKTLLFSDDALMYGAIFSNAELYECNFNRLIQRIKTQIDINLEKAKIMEGKGCNTGGLQSSLMSMAGAFEGKLIGNFKSIAEEVDKRNPKECAVF